MSSKENIVIRKAVPEDAAWVQRIQAKTWQATYPNEEANITLEDIVFHTEGENGELVGPKTASWRKVIENEERAMFVALIEGEPVGFVAPGIIDSKRRIGALYVLPYAQGTGIGKLLMEKALDWHGRHNTIYLESAAYNHTAIAFYSRYGFQPTGNAVRTSPPLRGGKVMPVLEMRRDGDATQCTENG